MTVESHSGLHSFLLIFWIFSHLLLFTGEAGGWESAPEQLSHPLVHCCTLSLCYLGAETGYRVGTPYSRM